MYEEAAISAQSIGIFGGTFDPVHSGHLALACLVRDRLFLDRLLIVPALQPPHKRRPVASFAHRVAMLELALAHCPECSRIECSRIEEELSAPSYTIHTVEALLHRLGAQRFVLVIGMDSLTDLPDWYRAEDLLGCIDLVVVNREELPPARIRELVADLRPAYRSLPDQSWINPSGKTLRVLAEFHQPLSSTVLREALRQGRSPQGLSPAVHAYIRSHGLYQGPPC